MTTFSRGKWLGLLCLLPFAVFFIVFQIAPLLWVAIHSLQSDAGWGWENFTRAFSSKFYRQAIQYSLEISFWSSLLGIIRGVQLLLEAPDRRVIVEHADLRPVSRLHTAAGPGDR